MAEVRKAIGVPPELGWSDVLKAIRRCIDPMEPQEQEKTCGDCEHFTATQSECNNYVQLGKFVAAIHKVCSRYTVRQAPQDAINNEVKPRTKKTSTRF